LASDELSGFLQLAAPPLLRLRQSCQPIRHYADEDNSGCHFAAMLSRRHTHYADFRRFRFSLMPLQMRRLRQPAPDIDILAALRRQSAMSRCRAAVRRQSIEMMPA